MLSRAFADSGAGDAAVVGIADDEYYTHADGIREIAKNVGSTGLSKLLNEFAAALEKARRQFNQ